MNILYTLTSSAKDYYYEQFLLSAASLKFFMPDAHLILLCDSNTLEALTDNRQEYKKYVNEIISVEAPEKLTQVEISRWVRTSMRRLVKGDFLFLDGDTIVTDDLSSVFKSGIIFGACLDKHSHITGHSKKRNIIKNNKKLKFNSHLNDKHYNGGVLYCSDTPEVHNIFNRWHELWLFCKSKKIIRDQPALNMAICENQSSFTELGGIWNCQIAYNGLPFLANSKVIHYFATDLVINESPFLLSSEDLFKEIKNTGVIPDYALELIKEARSAFAAKSQIICGNDMLYVVNSSIFLFIYLVKKRLPFVFIFYNTIFTIIKNILKKIFILFNRKKDGGIKFYN